MSFRNTKQEQKITFRMAQLIFQSIQYDVPVKPANPVIMRVLAGFANPAIKLQSVFSSKEGGQKCRHVRLLVIFYV